MAEKKTQGYVHGFAPEEQKRLYHQARFMEQRVHDRLPFQRARRLLRQAGDDLAGAVVQV